MSFPTSGVYDGHPWRYSQAVIDSMTQAILLGLIAYGLGDAGHWARARQTHSDHISIENSHPGWITAYDVMAKTGVFDPAEFCQQFLLPAVKAGFFPEILYFMTAFKLWDRRYGWVQQTGGDDAGHVHVTNTNSYALHSSVVLLFDKWKKAGRPAVVAWLRSGAAAGGSEADVSSVALSKGRTAIVVRGTDNRVYTRILGPDGKPAGDWTQLNVTAASGVDAASRTGDDLRIVCLDPKANDDSVLLVTVPDATKATATVQDMGGAGIGGAPGISATPDGLLLTVAGTYPHAGSLYAKTWSDTDGWSDWYSLDGVAK